jgi:hypothetical protein
MDIEPATAAGTFEQGRLTTSAHSVVRRLSIRSLKNILARLASMLIITNLL